MEKGDTVFFHPLLIHGSGINKTSGFRKVRNQLSLFIFKLIKIMSEEHVVGLFKENKAGAEMRC